MSIKLKICGIKERAVAELALELGVNYVGCILYPDSPRNVDSDKVEDIFGSLPEGTRVAVTVRPSVEDLKSILDLSLDYYQLHLNPLEDLDLAYQWSELVGKDQLWLAPKIAPNQSFPVELLSIADRFVIDSYNKDAYGGTGTTGSWSRFKEFQQIDPNKEWILAGGLSPENIKNAIAQTDANFLDVNSGVESNSGVKDVHKIQQLFQNIEFHS